MIEARYKAQVDILLTILPQVAKEKYFALKGGTAINLFVREMQRLSVDIDLTYTSITDNRETALKNISDAIDRIDSDIKKAVPGISITHVPHGQGEDNGRSTSDLPASSVPAHRAYRRGLWC